MNTEVYDKTNIVRQELFSSLGALDSDVIAPLINPFFMGGPKWPALRQAFSVIRTENSIKIASTGLSDPYDDIDEPNNGLKLEIIAETKEDIGNDISNSWLFRLVNAISQQAVYSGQMAEFLAKYGVITMDINALDNGLEDFQDENGIVGVIIGVEHPSLPKKIQFPAEEIILATVQILTPDELKYVTEIRPEGRNYIHNLMKQSGLYHYVTPNRVSLLKANDKKCWWKIWKKS
ncbi:hypothetical protein [Sulfurimonas sp.]|uniref:hypothetical protein n=1 Tax=Sulfurimonas sp. TaxID=2022749 RepID=UPI003D0AA748